MKDHTYGRGKFVAHERYIEYMRAIIDHPNYSCMPNAKTADGRINWQVSSGKTTSFYKDYLARKTWWIDKADSLNVPGKEDENDRFTMAARLIHPTGYRACRLCGEDFNVGYFYVNSNLAKRLKKDYPDIDVAKGQPIDDVIEQIRQAKDLSELQDYFRARFPERVDHFNNFGITKEAFEKSNHIRSSWLSPGYMGNPPDRLDGFHDYHLDWRSATDPGRSDENMRSYNHDRRSFEWWAEGNWAVADAIYNSAGPGKCSVPECGKELKIVSPDHVGPLACGFKQSGLFVPTCPNHNSAKNRRFTYLDTQRLIQYETKNGESAASWQVRAHWNKYKEIVSDDNQTKALSNSLRSLQDMYLRTLWEVYRSGQVRFLATLLHPEYALYDIEIVDLNSAELTFSDVRLHKKITNGRKSLAARTVRIAFDALREYASKPEERRKMVRHDFAVNSELISKAVREVTAYRNPSDEAWLNALSDTLTADEKERRISELFVSHKVTDHPSDEKSRAILQSLFDTIGQTAEIDFTRYAQTLDPEE